MLDQLLALLAKHQIQAPVEWNTDKPTRYESQWFVGKKWDYNGKEYYKAWFGDYKKDFEGKWNSYDEKQMSKDEIAAAKKQANDLLVKEKEEREKTFKESAKLNSAEFETFQTTGTTPYLERKLISSLYGARIKDNPGHDPILIVPLRDVEGRVWNYQRIYAQKLSKGDKFFADAARIEGLFHRLESVPGKQDGNFEPGSVVYICEGFATAASIKASFGDSPSNVVASFNAGNLSPVALAIKEKNPTCSIVICADNDAYTVINNKPYNVGIEKGRRAAGSVGGKIVYPIFKYPKKGFTDFNDLHAAEGLEIVRDQIEHPEKYVKGIQPMCLGVTDSGNLKKPTEKALVEHVLNYYGDNLLKCDENLFLYNGVQWKEFEERDYDNLKLQMTIAGNLDYKNLAACYKVLLFTVKHIPPGINFYTPNPYLANFQNGTLHLDPDKKIVFRPHDRSDYCTSVLPHDCPPLDAPIPETPMFDAWVARLWPDHQQREQVTSLLFELLGSCLTPAYPNITFFIGKSNSGKSTLVKFLVTAASHENTSQVQLCDLKGFKMESMLGKLVNFDTELDLNRPIHDVMVKKIIDRIPIDVDRKFKRAVSGYLPAVHIFAANDLPKTLEGQSAAYGRRIIAVHTSAPLGQGEVTRDFEKILWAKEGPALIQKAVKALERLHQKSGVFTVPPGSQELIDEMEKESDVVSQFFDYVGQGEVSNAGGRLVFGDDLSIKKGDILDIFMQWQKDMNIPLNQQASGMVFFKRAAKRLKTKQSTHDGRIYDGIGQISGAVGLRVANRVDPATSTL